MMSRVTASTATGRNGSLLRSTIRVFAIFGFSFMLNANAYDRLSLWEILLLGTNQDVSETINLTEMAGQDERRAIHLSDYRRALEHVVTKQSRAVVEFRGERALLRPNRSLTLERSVRVGSPFGHSSGFELAAFLLRDRA